MSSILDALKKLEEEKAARQTTAQAAPAPDEAVSSAELIEGLNQSKSQPAEGIHLSPKLLLGGGITLVVLLIGVSTIVSLAVVRSNTVSHATEPQVAAVAPPAPAENAAPAMSVTPAPTVAEAPAPVNDAAPVEEANGTAPEPEAPAPRVESPTPAAPVNAAPPKVDAAPPVKAAAPETPPTVTTTPEAPLQVAAVAPTPEAAPAPAAPAPAPEAVAEPMPSPTPAPEPEAAPVAEVAATAPATPTPEVAAVSVEAPPARTDPGPVNLRELPMLRNAERVQYGLEDLRLNMIREATPQRPEAMAIINLNKVYVGEMVPSTGARLIAVERHGVGIEVGGKRFYLQH